MGRSGETFSKKEKEKKRLKKRQEKEEKREERKANSNKGKSFEEQLAYVDEFGNLSPVPPDPKRKKVEVKVTEDGLVETIGEKDEEENTEHTGVVTFFNTEKGYGFIKDDKTREGVFVHINNLSGPLKERDKVRFRIQQADRGPQAVDVSMAE